MPGTKHASTKVGWCLVLGCSYHNLCMHGVVQAYNVLRGHANLFLNLLNLMRGSTVSGLTSDAEADITIAKVMKAIAVVLVCKSLYLVSLTPPHSCLLTAAS